MEPLVEPQESDNHLKIILNIGAGKNLLKINELPHREARSYVIYNLDIYNELMLRPRAEHGNPEAILREFRTSFHQPNVEYSDATALIDFEDNAADTILAVSPYGYSVINNETMRVLKPGGFIIVLGNKDNPWISESDDEDDGNKKKKKKNSKESKKEEGNVMSKDLLYIYKGCLDEIKWTDGDELVQDLVLHLLSTYESKTTKGNRPTFVSIVKVWKKRSFSADEWSWFPVFS